MMICWMKTTWMYSIEEDIWDKSTMLFIACLYCAQDNSQSGFYDTNTSQLRSTGNPLTIRSKSSRRVMLNLTDHIGREIVFIAAHLSSTRVRIMPRIKLVIAAWLHADAGNDGFRLVKCLCQSPLQPSLWIPVHPRRYLTYPNQVSGWNLLELLVNVPCVK